MCDCTCLCSLTVCGCTCLCGGLLAHLYCIAPGSSHRVSYVDKPTLQPFQKLFRALDVNPDGRLSTEDVETTARLKPTELKALRRANTQKLNKETAHTRLRVAGSTSSLDRRLSHTGVPVPAARVQPAAAGAPPPQKVRLQMDEVEELRSGWQTANAPAMSEV